MVAARHLRSELASFVRRAAAGERVVITVAGRPTALLGPVEAAPTEVDLATLVASGAVIPPRRTDGRVAGGTVPVWSNVRFDRLLGEVRG
ncbi:MAG: type II toxin-antitoxin system prevent-host-death family antitoxin [Ilumatobacteraceae bacterium]|jgi:prevent-host-death family protein